MKRKRKLTLADVNRLPVSPRVTKTTGYESGPEYLARITREEQEARDKPMREVISQTNELLRENNENVRQFFSLPMDQLNNARPSAVPVDFVIGTFPETAERPTAGEYRTIQLEFWETLKPRDCDLTEAGWVRLNIYVGTLCRSRKFAVTLDLVEASFQRLIDLSCFNEGEITGTVPAKTKRSAPAVSEPNIDNVLGQLADATSTDSPQWKKIVSQGWTTDFSKWFLAWIESLKKNFNYDFPVDGLGMKAANFLQKWNLSPFRYESWDKIRIAFVASGDFPDTMLTPQERLSQLIENSDTSDYSVRREIGRRQQELINAGPPLPPHK